MSGVEIFHIAPVAGKSLWPVVGMAAMVSIPIGVAVLVMYLVSSAKKATFEVSAEGLRIEGGFYSRTIAASAIELESIRVVDLAETPELGLKRRTNGTSLPGLKAGWFRLRNGDKALVFVTDQRKVIFFRTTESYSVLLSPGEPAQLAEALGRMASGG